MEFHNAACNNHVSLSTREEIKNSIEPFDVGVIPGAPDRWKSPCAPTDFKPNEAKDGLPPIEDT